MDLLPISSQSIAPLARTEDTTAPEADRTLALPGTDKAFTDTYEQTVPQGITYDNTGNIDKSSENQRPKKDESQGTSRGRDGKPLSSEEEARVRELKTTDMKVRAHEQAHMASGSGLVKGGASYSYEKGPDGNRYAVGGEVSIDTSEGKTPRETVARMQRVRAAALAPADPSSQDRRVAAAAAAKAAAAVMELVTEKSVKNSGTAGTSEGAHKAGMEAYQKSLSAAISTRASINIIG